jgi:hypothetical protein
MGKDRGRERFEQRLYSSTDVSICCLYICTVSIHLIDVQQPSRGSRHVGYRLTGAIDDGSAVTTINRRSCLLHASTCQVPIGTAHGMMQPLNAQYLPPSSELMLTITSPFTLHPVPANAQSNTISTAYCIHPKSSDHGSAQSLVRRPALVVKITSRQARFTASLAREDV